MNQSLDELERILNKRIWPEVVERLLLALAVLGGLYWSWHIVRWGFGGFDVGL